MNDAAQRDHVAVLTTSIDPADAYRRILDDRAGATVVFTGNVRNHSEGKIGVTHLEYEAYGDHVTGKIAEIVAEARERWDVLHVAVEHRTGHVDLREVSVVVGVSAAHRAAAFEAARYIIDELKHRAPIWKKEHWPGGAEWSPGS